MAAPIVENTAFATVGGGGNTTITVDVSSLGTAADDHLIAVVIWRAQGAITPTEAGWTELHDSNQTNGPSVAVYERVDDGGNTSFTFTFSGSAARVCAGIARVSGSTGTVDASAAGVGTSTTPTAPDATSGGADRLVLRAYGWSHTDSVTGWPPSGYTSVWTLASGGAAAGHVANYLGRITAGSGAVGTLVGVTLGSSRNWVGATIIIEPLEVVTGTVDAVLPALASSHDGTVEVPVEGYDWSLFLAASRDVDALRGAPGWV